MDWIEAKIVTASEGLEPVSAVLLENGITGFQIFDDEDTKSFLLTNPDRWDYIDEEFLDKPSEPPSIMFYLPKTPEGYAVFNEIKLALELLKKDETELDLGSLSLESSLVDDASWLENWKKYYKPFQIGSKVIICPVWEDFAEPGKIVFRIDPGYVFGTGLHQSTQLCIEQLEKYFYEGFSVADIGCGSGILSVIALMLGAKNADACDIDIKAGQIACENAGRNGISLEHYRVFTGNILTDNSLFDKFRNNYDILLANIVADVIIPLSPLAFGMVKPGGLFISSGIIDTRLREVKSAVESAGFEILETSQKDVWFSITARRLK